MAIQTRLVAGTLRAWSSGSYTADVDLDGGQGSYLEGIPVARDIASAEMSAGRRVAVFFTDINNQNEAVVIAVWT